MNSRRSLKSLFAGLAVIPLMSAPSAFACAACFGQSDSRLAVGMNWGIFALLAVVGSVLSGFAVFGVYLAKRSAAYQDGLLPQPPAQPTDKI